MSLPYNNTEHVKKSGDTMTGLLEIETPNSNMLRLKATAIDVNKSPNVNTFANIDFVDKNNVNIGHYSVKKAANGSVATAFNVRNPQNNKYATIGVGFDVNGKAYTIAPTPPVNSDDTNIATTAFCSGRWIKKTLTIMQDGSLSGGGVSKEFSLSSYLPNDGRVYEVMIRTNFENLSGYSLAFFTGQLFAFADIVRFQKGYGGNCQILPIGTDRKLTIGTNSSSSGTLKYYIQAVAYRRVR